MEKRLTPKSTASGPRNASLEDVAQLAGVSAQTVSRVSNKRHNVSEETRTKVLRAMRELNYRPNSAARALKYGRFKTIGVILFDMSNYGNTRTLDSIALAASSAGYSLTLFPIREPTYAGLARAFEQLNEAVVDGIILIADVRLVDRTEFDAPAEVPIVLANTVASKSYAVVDTDQAQGAREATQHLLNMGHETVWLIDGPETSFSANSRKEVWRETLIAAGATVHEPYAGDWSANSGYQAGKEIAKDPNVTAVFALNDQMALGAMRAFHEHGLRIPEDISIVGFDDIEEAHSFWPPLTTVRQNFTGVGAACMRIILGEIEAQKNFKGKTMILPELVVRGSSGPARVDRGFVTS